LSVTAVSAPFPSRPSLAPTSSSGPSCFILLLPGSTPAAHTDNSPAPWAAAIPLSPGCLRDWADIHCCCRPAPSSSCKSSERPLSSTTSRPLPFHNGTR
jgi:hypothetical protein